MDLHLPILGSSSLFFLCSFLAYFFFHVFVGSFILCSCVRFVGGYVAFCKLGEFPVDLMMLTSECYPVLANVYCRASTAWISRPCIFFLSSELQYLSIFRRSLSYFVAIFVMNLISQVCPLWFSSCPSPGALPNCISLATFRSSSGTRLLCVFILSLIFSHFRHEFKLCSPLQSKMGSLWLSSFASPCSLTREFVTVHFSIASALNICSITFFIVSVTNFPIVMGSPHRSATLLACDHVGAQLSCLYNKSCY